MVTSELRAEGQRGVTKRRTEEEKGIPRKESRILKTHDSKEKTTTTVQSGN